jgi:hypothetical protein
MPADLGIAPKTRRSGETPAGGDGENIPLMAELGYTQNFF